MMNLRNDIVKFCFRHISVNLKIDIFQGNMNISIVVFLVEYKCRDFYSGIWTFSTFFFENCWIIISGVVLRYPEKFLPRGGTFCIIDDEKRGKIAKKTLSATLHIKPPEFILPHKVIKAWVVYRSEVWREVSPNYAICIP